MSKKLIRILVEENADKWNIEYTDKYNEYRKHNLQYEKNYKNIILKMDIEFQRYHDKYMFEEVWHKWFKTIEDYYKVYPFKVYPLKYPN